jgi:NitT/TauT family transport system substrate-binding protein
VREPQYFSVNLFLRHGVDACSAMWYNEYHTILQCGIDPDELTVFKLWEHGSDFPEDGIYCLEQTAVNDPALCRDIAEASLEGWVYAKDHFEEALDIVMKYIDAGHVPTNRAHMKWMLRVMLDSIFPGAGDKGQFGVLSRERYDNSARLLMEQKLIKSAPAFEKFHWEVLNNAH